MWYSAIIKVLAYCACMDVCYLQEKRDFFGSKIETPPKKKKLMKKFKLKTKKMLKKTQSDPTFIIAEPKQTPLEYRPHSIKRFKKKKFTERERIRSSRDWWATVRQTGRPPLSKRCSLFALQTTTKNYVYPKTLSVSHCHYNSHFSHTHATTPNLDIT